MSKAIEGAAMLGGAVLMGAAAFMDPALLASPLFDKIWASLVIGGISMEAGAIAGALTSNRGTNITTRQPASFRQIIYGEQRVGGVVIYRSTTGSHHDQYNYIIVLAGHEIDSIVNLYLDGRQVFWNVGSANNVNRNGVNFGGDADHNDHTGPNGQRYNFGTLVYCEARFGDQAVGDWMTSIHANDPTWGPSASGTPYVGGCAYVYLKVEYDTAMFPGEPEIRFTIRGKNNIYDPRTGTRGYTHNWALVVADVLTDTQFGLGDDTVNQEQLIAAANVCDELVPLATAGSELRYSCHYHYDTSMGPGDVLQTMMPAAAGRLSRIGGEWYIWPAYWQGPSYTFDQNALTGSPQWNPYRSFRDLFNRVAGTYIAPNYPYNDAGNLYDSNGWYYGTTQNNFPFAFQPTNYPQYAADLLHGYAADEYLEQDNNVPLPKEIPQQCCLSVTQAQRVAKIYLLRNRHQGSGTFPMFLAAWRMQPCDVVLFSFPENGWLDKVLEVETCDFTVDTQGDAPRVLPKFKLIETSASVYEWSAIEELTVYDVPASPTQVPYVPAPPENLTLTSSAATALIGLDGIVRPRILAEWDTPLDRTTYQIQLQYQLIGAMTWQDAGYFGADTNQAFIDNVIAASQYNVRIRSLRFSGATSIWIEVDGFTVSLTLTVLTQTDLAPNNLTTDSFNDGTADINVFPFTAHIGNAFIPILPGGAYTIVGLSQGVLYYVYYIDPNFLGGAIVPIATRDRTQFVGKLGYFLIGSITATVVAVAGGGGVYSPSTFDDTTSESGVAFALVAYDGDPNTAATILGFHDVDNGNVYSTFGECKWYGFPPLNLLATKTFSITALTDTTYTPGTTCTITAYIGTTATVLLSTTSNTPKHTYTMPIPPGTVLSNVSVVCRVDGSTATVTSPNRPFMEVFEIFIS